MNTAAYLCTACRGALSAIDGGLRCCDCGQSWPVRDNVPRFFEPSYYWGEITQPEAEQFLRDAREKGWRNTVLEKFANDPEMQLSLLDWQRASWLPLLGLDAGAVVLDVGCGYGAITHSLSGGAGQVYSLEAIPHRLEFTRIRLEQENIRNVQLVQATALDPPFQPGMFDLIVVNGILEWVGEWASDADPRDVQLRFLRQISAMLKPDGVCLVGIENRISYESLRGAIDHSALPYTNLMPRPVASWYLRRKLHRHHRTELNAERQYRTYTYSERGYRKLLSESGLPSAAFFWADPGYNQPYYLVPCESDLVKQHLRYKSAEPIVRRSHWKHQVKKMVARPGLVRATVPEFVILASKNGSHTSKRLWQQLRKRLPHIPEISNPVASQITSSFGLKNVLRIFASGHHSSPVCIVKTSTRAPGSAAHIENEYQTLSHVHERFKTAQPGVAVPEPLGITRMGHFSYAVESFVAGLSVGNRTFTAEASERANILAGALPPCIRGAIEIARILRGDDSIRRVDSSWRDIPRDLQSSRGADEVAAALSSLSWDSEWAHHGDFTIENAFVQPDAQKLTVIDWEHSFRGGPPLYDLYSFLLSAVPIVQDGSEASTDIASRWEEHFREAFFGEGVWAHRFAEAIATACEALSLDKSAAWPMFVQFLLFRLHYMRGRGSLQSEIHTRLFTAAAANRGRFILR